MDNSPPSVPRLYRCCFVFGLRSGVLIFTSIEALCWMVLSFVAMYSEFKYMNFVNLEEFTDYVYDHDWYFYLVFSSQRDNFDEAFRTNIIVLNLILTMFFCLYFIFTIMLLVGIAKHSKTLFIPYLLFDIFFLIVTLILGIVGSFFRLNISKLCIFFFFIKLYSSVLVYSLMKDYQARRKASDKISIHSAASQHLTAIDAEEEEFLQQKSPGLGEAPKAVAV